MICLTMIVKNEAAVIQRCLQSVLPFIDCWAIVDTGSTDNTKEIILKTLKSKPGILESMDWVDFSTCRNQALETARENFCFGPNLNAVYAFTIDADEVFAADIGFRGFEEIGGAKGGVELRPAWYVNLNYGATIYKRLALFRLFSDFTWVGPVHETLVSSNYPGPYDSFPFAEVKVINDGASSKIPSREKYLEHARLLQKALETEPENTRYQFYLAQSYKDAGELDLARAAYIKRVEMKGWEEEIYYSMLQLGRLYEGSCEWFRRAIECRPQRAEAWCEAARVLRLKRMYHNAKTYALAACDAVDTEEWGKDILFIDQSVYDWRAKDELAVALYWCGDKRLCGAYCQELLGSGKLPESERDRVKKNLEFCK